MNRETYCGIIEAQGFVEITKPKQRFPCIVSHQLASYRVDYYLNSSTFAIQLLKDGKKTHVKNMKIYNDIETEEELLKIVRQFIL